MKVLLLVCLLLVGFLMSSGYYKAYDQPAPTCQSSSEDMVGTSATFSLPVLVNAGVIDATIPSGVVLIKSESPIIPIPTQIANSVTYSSNCSSGESNVNESNIIPEGALSFEAGDSSV